MAMTSGRALLARVRQLLLRRRGVVGVGLGVRSANDRRRVWRVYVNIDHVPRLPIPSVLFGWPTMVVPAACGRPAGKKPKEPVVYTPGMFVTSKVPGSLLKEGLSEQGALGCFAKDADGKTVLLTNSHVMFPKFMAVPHLGVYQPDYSSCCGGGDKIATAVFDKAKVKDGQYRGGFNRAISFRTAYQRGFGPNGYKRVFGHQVEASNTDCAIARLEPGVQFNNLLPVPGPDGPIKINGINEDLTEVIHTIAGTMPEPHHWVRVFSPRKGGHLIHGTILWSETQAGTLFTKRIDEGTPRERLITAVNENVFGVGEEAEKKGAFPMTDQMIILPRPSPKGITTYAQLYNQPNLDLTFDYGDSGSVVLDYKNRVIGQVYGGFEFIAEAMVPHLHPEQLKLPEFRMVKNIGTASPIRWIVELLGITIPENGYSGTVPASATHFAVDGRRDLRRDAEREGIDRLREALRASRRGRFVIGKVGQHRHEVRQLLARVRAIAAAWRDLQGPRFYFHLVENARDASHVIPMSINGVTRGELIDAMAPLLVQYGSPALRRDVERYQRWLAPLIAGLHRLDELPAAVAVRPRP